MGAESIGVSKPSIGALPIATLADVDILTELAARPIRPPNYAAGTSSVQPTHGGDGPESSQYASEAGAGRRRTLRGSHRRYQPSRR